MDPARQFASPYVAMGNYPIGYYDEDRRWVWLIPMAIGGITNAIMNADQIHDFGDFALQFGIGAAQGLLTYYSAGGAAAFSTSFTMSNAAQAGLIKFGQSMAANMIWDMAYRKTGLFDQVRENWRIGFDIAFNIFGPDAIEGGIAASAEPHKDLNIETVDDISKENLDGFDQNLNVDGTRFKENADWTKTLKLTHKNGETAYIRIKPAQNEIIIIGDHTATVAKQGVEGKSFGTMYATQGVCQTGVTQTINKAFRAHFLPTQLMPGRFNIGFYQAVFGNGYLPGALFIHSAYQNRRNFR